MSSRGATPAAVETTLLVFARAPAPGRVKTRLVPLLGAREAARLHARLVEATLATAAAAGFARLALCCAPDTRSAFFRRLRKRFKLRLLPQGRGDLGERMYRALRRHPGAVLIGSDCPVLRAADLRAAARALGEGADAVIAPAEDGGYALIGVRRAARGLFSGVRWGGAKVLEQTRARLRTLGWCWRELRTLWDVDRPEDFARLLRARRRRISSAARRRARPSAGSRRRSGAPRRT